MFRRVEMVENEPVKTDFWPTEENESWISSFVVFCFTAPPSHHHLRRVLHDTKTLDNTYNPLSFVDCFKWRHSDFYIEEYYGVHLMHSVKINVHA